MNQAEEYRQTQEQRYLIDRAIPAVDYGKGCKFSYLLTAMKNYQKKFCWFLHLGKWYIVLSSLYLSNMCLAITGDYLIGM